MNYKEKIVTLKNNQTCILRSPRPEDAQEIIDHMIITSEETVFMARYPEEITLTYCEESKFLEDTLSNPKSLMICAVLDGKIVANAGISCVNKYSKYLHRASFGISIQKEYWNLGIGKIILEELIILAKEMGYEQMELDVVCDNERGVALYKKCGFEIYGTREEAFKFKDGSYASEYLMFKKL